MLSLQASGFQLGSRTFRSTLPPIAVVGGEPIETFALSLRAAGAGIYSPLTAIAYRLGKATLQRGGLQNP